MADTKKFVAVKPTRLSAGITSAASSFSVAAVQDRAGNTLTMSDFGDTGYGVFEPNTSEEEHFTFTNISGTTITIGSRGLAMKSPYTNVSANQKAHAAGTKVILYTNLPALYDRFVLKDNDEIITGTYTFDADTMPRADAAVSYTAGSEEWFATKRYVDSVVTSGAPDANTTTKGLVEIATQTEVNEGDDTGGTTAPVVLIPSTHLDTMDRVVTTDYTYGDTIAAGDVLYLDTATAKWELADASVEATADGPIGIAIDTGTDGSTGKRVQIKGVVTGLSGLTVGWVFLSDTSGDLAAAAGTYRRIVGYAPNTTTMILMDSLSIDEVAGLASTVTSTLLASLITPKFGGTGADGTLDTSGGTVNIDLGSAEYVEKNYTSINIVTNNLTFSNPATKGTVVVIRCSGNCTISATIVANFGAAGAAGGAGGVTVGAVGADGSDASDSDEILDASDHFGLGGDGGAVNSGGTAEAPTTAAYTTTGVGRLYPISTEDLYRRFIHVVPGAGGGGGGGGCAGNEGANFGAGGAGGAGGRGGGALVLEVKGAINFTGTINAGGTAGTAGTIGGNGVGTGPGGGGGGGGAGGGGGYVVILYNTLTSVAGTVTVTGGNGAAGGNQGVKAGSPSGGTGGGGGQGGSAGASVQGSGGSGGNGADGNGGTGATGGASAAGGAEGTAGTAGNAPTGATANGDGGAGGGGGGGGGGESLVAQNKWFY